MNPRATVFDGAAGHYDDDPFHRAVAEALVAPLPTGPALVLDVATGTGFAAFAALRLAPSRVLAVDVSTAMLARAAAKAPELDPAGRIEWRAGPAVPMPAANHSADVVLCASSLHFLGAAALADWHRVLRPGGRLAFSIVSRTRFRPSPRLAALVPDDLPLPSDEREAAALAAGFTDVSATTFALGDRSVFLVSGAAARP